MGEYSSTILDNRKLTKELSLGPRKPLLPANAIEHACWNSPPNASRCRPAEQLDQAPSGSYEVLFTLAYDRDRDTYVLIYDTDSNPYPETIDNQTANALIESVHHTEWNGTASAGKKVRNHTPQLNPREMEVLQAVADGLTNRAIAAKLHISENTAKRHLQSIFTKLGVLSRTQAAMMALSLGWISLGKPATAASCVDRDDTRYLELRGPENP